MKLAARQVLLHYNTPPRNMAWRLSNNIWRYPLASAILLFGLSAANAFGGFLQITFFGWCLSVAVTSRHQIPLPSVILATFCGLIALFASYHVEPSMAPFVKFVRPFFEGYLLAIALYKVCQIRTFRSLMIVLAGYVLLEFMSLSTMMIFPDIRLSFIDLWYSDEAYQQVAFQNALLFRGYGISRHHLFGLPLAMGTASIMLFVTGSLSSPRKWRIYFITAAFLGFLIILPNARIGLLPFIVCYALGASVFFDRYYFKQLAILLLVFLPAIYLIAQAYLGDVSNFIAEWLLEGILQFVNPSDFADSNTFSDLSGMVVLPTDLSSWLFGDGKSCISGESCYTDIGWLRMLQEGGLFLLVAVTILYMHAIFLMCSRFAFTGFKADNKSIITSRRLLFFVLAITFIGATIKGDSFGANDFSRLIMMLGVLSSLVNPKGSHQQISHTRGDHG